MSAQQVDLRNLLGNALYTDLIRDFQESPSLPLYGDLWNGSNWICGDKTYSHLGLKTMLCLFAYARYVVNSNLDSTYSGTQLKENQYSTNAEDKALIRLHDNTRSEALAYWADIERYLCDNSEDYPLWCHKKDNLIKKIQVIGVDNGIRRQHFTKNRFRS